MPESTSQEIQELLGELQTLDLTPEESALVGELATEYGGDESGFRDWYSGHAQALDLDPDPDHPLHYYDWRAAWRSGVTPDEEGHWPSEFKLEGHPNLVVDGRDTRTGERVGKSLAGFGSNILSSAAQAGRDIIDLPPALLSLGQLDQEGTVRLLSEVPAAVSKYFADSYGSVEKAADHLYTNPVQFVMDLSMVTGGAGVLTKLAGKAGKLSALAKAGEGLTKVGRGLDPVVMAAKGLEYGTRVPRHLAGGLSGAGLGAAIGSGSDVPGVAIIRNSDTFRKHMRSMRVKGKQIGPTKLEEAEALRDALKDVQKKRQGIGSELGQFLETNNRFIDAAPIDQKLSSLMAEYRIPVKKGVPDISGAKVGKQGRGDIADVIEMVQNRPDDTVIGLDTLKTQLGDYVSESRQARKFATAMQDEIRKLLAAEVPGYAEMNARYADISGAIREIERGLSLGTQKGHWNPGPTIDKIAGAFSSKHDYPQVVIDLLGEASGRPDLLEMVAGSTLQGFAPKGIMRPITGSFIVLGGAATGQWWAIPTALLVSPRMTGELLNLVARLRQGSIKLVGAYPGAAAHRPLTIGAEPEEMAFAESDSN